MPQLIPAPWFMTMLMTWIILLMMLIPMTMQINSLLSPKILKSTIPDIAWIWLWY
uniref:ATPase subunit 8 n=1 Tax=Aeluroscalabotes felinus TaxID=96749 RepID=A0A1Y1CC46_AELFE|nr:ATP synthase F0 subunit 8 [Aeluroscalabotes felinus]BAX77927.1 ATPase subunit 8 [Aeluroscalabotes felinus]